MLSFALGACLLPLTAVSQESSQLESLRQSFNRQERILLDAYCKAIDAVMEAAKKRSDLKTYLVAEAEKKKMSAGSTATPPASAPAALKDAAESYCRARIVLLKKQISALDGYIKEEMRFDQIENAKTGKSDRDILARELVALEANLPKDETLKGGSPAPDNKAGKDDGLKAATPIRPKPAK